MAKRSTKADPPQPDNRAILVAAVKAYMWRHHRGESIDTVQSRPVDALRMGLSIALKHSQLRSAGRARHLIKLLERHVAQAHDDVGRVHHVLQTAMAARKRGKLRIGDYAQPEGE